MWTMWFLSIYVKQIFGIMSNTAGAWKWIHTPVEVRDGGGGNVLLQCCDKVRKKLRL